MSEIYLIICVLFAWMQILSCLSTSPTARFAVIIDAGSSGSRVRVFGWRNEFGLPQGVQELHSYKTRPGISKYVEDLPSLQEYVQDLLDQAIEAVPEHKHRMTPIYLMATAGMRLILEDKARDVMAYLQDLLQNDSRTPFMFENRNCRILSGEEEGVFMWIAANYLRGYFTQEVPDSVGILELGGASMQIAFQTEGPLLADKFPVLIGRHIYELYVHSYLHYGQTSTMKWVLDYIAQQNPNETTLDCPCLLKGDHHIHDFNSNVMINFTGSGDAVACRAILQEFVYDADPVRCFPKPCAIGTVYQPTIPSSKVFYAVSAFVYTTQVLKVVGKDGQLNLNQFTDATTVYCAKNLELAHNETGIDKEYLSNYCLTGTYMPVLFTDGFGFPPDSDKIYVKDEINNIAAEWALGALLYESELLPVCPNRAPSHGFNVLTLLFIFAINVFKNIS